MAYFRPGARTAAAISYKGGGSPVTEADFAVDRFLFEEMRRLAPDAGWLSEETADTDARLSRENLIIVDPIDGTHAFTRGDERWAVSIALIESGRPAAGVVHAPARGETFTAAHGLGAFLNGERLGPPRRALAIGGAVAIAPRPLHARIAQAAAKHRIRAAHCPRWPCGLWISPQAGTTSSSPRPMRATGTSPPPTSFSRRRASLWRRSRAAPLTYNRRSSKRGMLVAAPMTLIEETRNIARTVSKGIDWS